MRPSDLPSAEVLGRDRPHGHKMRYMAGCRCEACRKGNSEYERKMALDRELYGPNDLVPVDEVRTFLLKMQALGIGYKTVAKHVGVGKTALGRVVWPGNSGRTYIRRRTQNKVLSYDPHRLENLPASLRIPAAETVAKVRQLIKWGYPKLLINRDGLRLSGGLQMHSLKPKTAVVTTKNAIKIRDFFQLIESMRGAWLAEHGPIPRGHFVYRKPGGTATAAGALELRPFATGYDFNYRYPPELKEAISLAHRVRKTYREKRRNEKHDRGPAQSSVRGTRSTPGQREAHGD